MRPALPSVCVVIALATLPLAGGAQTALTYRVERPAGRDLATRFSDDQIEILEKINRASREHLGRLGELVVPDRWISDERVYSPLPQRYEAARALPKLLVVHLPGQLFGAYESGALVRWGPLSSGTAATPTPAGLYHLTWRATGRASTVNPEWFMRWYFNFENDEGRAFHEYDLPGEPASHSCVRLLARDARWLFDWGTGWQLDPGGTTVVEPGTPVLIVGAFDFGAPRPWRDPAWLHQAVALPATVSGN